MASKIFNIGPGIKSDLSTLKNQGSVYNAGMVIDKSAMLSSITFTCNNLIAFKGIQPAINYLMFDDLGLFQQNSGIAVIPPDSATSSVSGIKSMSGKAPVLLKGFNYQVTTSPAQFSNPLRMTLADADGSTRIVSLNAQQARRNNQFQNNLLTFECEIYIDAFRGLLLTVNPNERVDITVMLAVNYNRQ